MTHDPNEEKNDGEQSSSSPLPPPPQPPQDRRTAPATRTGMHPCLIIFLVVLGLFVVGVLLLFGLCLVSLRGVGG